MTKCEDVTHKVSVNYSSPEENSFFGESLWFNFSLIVTQEGGVGVGGYSRLGAY